MITEKKYEYILKERIINSDIDGRIKFTKTYFYYESHFYNDKLECFSSKEIKNMMRYKIHNKICYVDTQNMLYSYNKLIYFHDGGIYRITIRQKRYTLDKTYFVTQIIIFFQI